MHGMHGGCHGCNCNCDPMTPKEEKEQLTDFKKMLEDKLSRVKDRVAELSKEEK